MAKKSIRQVAAKVKSPTRTPGPKVKPTRPAKGRS